MPKTRLPLFLGASLFALACAVAQSTVGGSKNRPANVPMQPAAHSLDLPKTPAKTSAQQANEASRSTSNVSIDNFSFAPAAITVPIGTTVTWVNKDDVPHTVVSTDRVFASHVLDADDKFSYTFNKAGKYEYFCSVHPKMMATVVVK